MSISNFYKGRNVLVTGATGFMGKCLLEKLMRTFPDVGQVFIMIRELPEQETYTQRCDTLLNSPARAIQLFDRVRKEDPKFVDKIVPIYGDLLQPEFGMKPYELATLQRNVHIVFHFAATVKFKEPIRQGVKNKIVAVKELCDMCRDFKHLKSLVHVSTAWINLPNPICEERIYSVDPSKLLTAYEKNDDAALAEYEQETKRGEGLGTYLYTTNKRVGESVLAENSESLPVAIVRPSNVLAALREPYPGWMDGSHGLGPILEQVSKGKRTMVFGDPTLNMPDIIPVDFSVNVCLAAAWYRASHVPPRLRSSDMPIFNSASGTVNPVCQDEMYKYAQRFPVSARDSARSVTIYTSMRTYRWHALTKPLLRSFCQSLWPPMMRKRNSIAKEVRYQYDYMRLWSPTLVRDYKFTQYNVDRLQALLTATEREMLPMDPRSIDWEKYIDNYCRHL